jgi:glutaredoxin
MEEIINTNNITILKIPNCINCTKVCELFDEIDATPYQLVDISQIEEIEFDDVMTYLEEKVKTRMFPMVFVCGQYIGDYKEIQRKFEVGLLYDIFKNKLDLETKSFDI